MDDFEVEYFRKLSKLTPDFISRRRDLAISRIRMFVFAVCRQLIEYKENYDLLIGAGNSGLFMTRIADMTYDYLKIKTPIILNLPIFRFKEDNVTINDNSSLFPQVVKVIQNIDNIKNILFVDDEIMRALTAKACFSLICKAKTHIQQMDATIIAEDHFFEWHYKVPEVSVKFFSYSRLIQGLNGNIGHFIPEDLHKIMSQINKEAESYNHAMAIIFGGALKRRNAHREQFFDFNFESIFKDKVVDYEYIKSLLIDELQKIVRDGVEKYKAGEIKFRY